MSKWPWPCPNEVGSTWQTLLNLKTWVHTYHYPRLHVHGWLCGRYWSPSSPAVHSERSPRSRGCWSWSRISSLPRSPTSHTPVITEQSHVSKGMVPMKLQTSLSTVHPDFKQRMIPTLFLFTNHLLFVRWDIGASNWLKYFFDTCINQNLSSFALSICNYFSLSVLV